MRDEGDAEAVVLDIYQCQAYAIDRDRAFAGHLPGLGGRRVEPHGTPLAVVIACDDGSNGVDVTGYIVAAEGIARAERCFDVDDIARFQLAQVRPGERFLTSLERNSIAG